MLPTSQPDEPRRRQLEGALQKSATTRVVLSRGLLTIIVFAAASGIGRPAHERGPQRGTLLLVLHTAGRRSAGVRSVGGGRHRLDRSRRRWRSTWATPGRQRPGDGLLLAVVAADRHPAPDRPGGRHHRPDHPRGAVDPPARPRLRVPVPLIATTAGTPFFVQTDAPGRRTTVYFSYTTLARRSAYGGFTAATSLGRMVAVSRGVGRAARTWCRRSRCWSATSGAPSDATGPADDAATRSAFGEDDDHVAGAERDRVGFAGVEHHAVVGRRRWPRPSGGSRWRSRRAAGASTTVAKVTSSRA